LMAGLGFYLGASGRALSRRLGPGDVEG
jgi:hypothetical protein